MLIRPVTPEDKAVLTRLFSELSLETRYRRFFMAVREMDEARFAFLTELDHHDREALVAVESVSGAGAGVARYVRIVMMLLSRQSWWRTAGSGWVWEACFSSD